MYEKALKQLTDNGKKTDVNIKTSLRSISKMLQSLQKSPTDIRYRKLRMDHIVVKKFVTGIPGASALMEAVGFRKTTLTESGKKLDYLLIEALEVKTDMLERAITLIEQRLRAIEHPTTPAPSTVGPTTTAKGDPPKTGHKYCTGGCGFWGDDKTEGMCSLCYRKKYFGLTKSEQDAEAKKSGSKSRKRKIGCTVQMF